MLIYSTCSLEREEGEGVVEEAMQDNQSFQVLDLRSQLEALRTEGEFVAQDFKSSYAPYLRTTPGVHLCDGFFVAMLQRIE
jgi:16S rRNA C967 or C1407 C5-methylase (RsmB/RsmF family)